MGPARDTVSARCVCAVGDRSRPDPNCRAVAGRILQGWGAGQGDRRSAAELRRVQDLFLPRPSSNMNGVQLEEAALARRADHTKEELTEMVIVAGARPTSSREGIGKLSARVAVGAYRLNAGDALPTTSKRPRRDRHGGECPHHRRCRGGIRRGKDNRAIPREMLHNYADAFVGFIEANAHLWEALFEFKRAAGIAVPEWYRRSIEALAETIAPWFQGHPSQMQPNAQAAEAGKLILRQHPQRFLAAELRPAGAAARPRHALDRARAGGHPHQGVRAGDRCRSLGQRCFIPLLISVASDGIQLGDVVPHVL